MNFISTPNLPKSKVCVFIANTPIEGATVIKPPKMDMLPPSLSRHADLSIAIVSSKKAVCPPESYAYYKSALFPYGFEIIEGKTHLGCNYPLDSAYNVCIIGKKCFLNKKVCDPTLYDILISEGYEIIFVNQGYTKCSICPIDENTFITADKGIYDKGVEMGFEALLISNEGILLPDYKNGFWGGCCGLGAPDTLLVNGDVETIKSGNLIKEFLNRKGIKIKNLKKGEVIDIGSVLPLMTT